MIYSIMVFYDFIKINHDQAANSCLVYLLSPTARLESEISIRFRELDFAAVAESVSSYTCNISEWSWRQESSAGENTYAFTYDPLSRLTDMQ